MGKKVATIDDFPTPPEGSAFRLRKVTTISQPHPYCITGRHIVHAADKWGGRLGAAAIESAERGGAHCGWKGCQLPYDEHTSDTALVIEVDDNRDLNKVVGLQEYLLLIKEKAQELNVDGFAFPNPRQQL
jgi:hypothetical protein